MTKLLISVDDRVQVRWGDKWKTATVKSIEVYTSNGLVCWHVITDDGLTGGGPFRWGIDIREEQDDETKVLLEEGLRLERKCLEPIDILPKDMPEYDQLFEALGKLIHVNEELIGEIKCLQNA